ncbi:MAG: DUF5715 family protein [Bacteroides sp.]|nr:DUF5715 family protein [Bacteroides sp.]
MSIPVAEVRGVTVHKPSKRKNNKPKRRKREPKKILLVVLGVAAALGVWAMSGGAGSSADSIDNNATIAAAETCPDIAWIFDTQANPYEQCLPAMPDDGCMKMKINPLGGTLGRVFCDSNHVHLASARAIGIKPIENINDVWNLRRPLVEIETCEDFYVDQLTHSYPYLVPEAAELLHEIGRRFNAELADRGGGSYRLKVTSVLRTPATVSKLRRVNRNATTESTHQYGTTFDISYSKFICDSITVNRTQEDLKNLLGEVMHALRNEGRCFVKYERKQSCFHITARQ